MLDVIKGEGAGKLAASDWPTAIAVGGDCYSGIKSVAEATLKNLELWRDVSFSTNFA